MLRPGNSNRRTLLRKMELSVYLHGLRGRVRQLHARPRLWQCWCERLRRSRRFCETHRLIRPSFLPANRKDLNNLDLPRHFQATGNIGHRVEVREAGAADVADVREAGARRSFLRLTLKNPSTV